MKRMHINGGCLASYASEIDSGRETSLEAQCITPPRECNLFYSAVARLGPSSA
jgi:hypothetical protein